MSPTAKKALFFVGIALLAHAFYMAMSMRQQLHAWHHGRLEQSTVSLHGTAVPARTMMVPIAIEVLAGLCIAMVGFILRSPLSEARLQDFTKPSRYDQQMQTGVPFMTFNHRGTVRNRASGAAQAESATTAENRKKE